MFVAILLILLVLTCSIAATLDYNLVNFSPVMAIAFCSAIYFRKRMMWLIPFVALLVSDFYVNKYYVSKYDISWPCFGFIARNTCIVFALATGAWVSLHKSWLWIFNGSLLTTLLFYLITNTQAWASDAFYPKSTSGWWQALTIGHPEYLPTIYFFRNTLFGNLIFTGLFSGIMEWLAHHSGKLSLLDYNNESEDEAIPGLAQSDR